MPGLVPGIHVFLLAFPKQDVDGRDKPGHDGSIWLNYPAPISGSASSRSNR